MDEKQQNVTKVKKPNIIQQASSRAQSLKPKSAHRPSRKYWGRAATDPGKWLSLPDSPCNLLENRTAVKAPELQLGA